MPPARQPEKTWTVLELLRTTEQFFKDKGVESPRLDAELLLARAHHCKRIELYTQFDRPVAEEELDAFRDLVRRRGLREPVHYILGEREFFSRPFKVSQPVLVPRPETELLVESALAVLRVLPAESGPLTIADIGTGSGNIAVALACECPDLVVHATDVSQDALAIAADNAERHGVTDRVTFHQGDLLAALDDGLQGALGAVISNPPYITSTDLAGLMPEVRDHEPRLALDGGPDGLDFYRRLVSEAPGWLCGGGHLILELGQGQAAEVCRLLNEHGSYQDPALDKDYAGIERVVRAGLGK